MSKHKILFGFLSAFLFSSALNSASASVTMLGTRIIYNAEIKEKSLDFTNAGDNPFLVQVWTDKNNPNSTAETADAPFIVMPSIFRINSHAQHSLRLKFTGTVLPQDRESLFWLNFLQYPAKSAAAQGKNSLTMLVKSRIKIFYRPSGLVGDANKSLDELKVGVQGKKIDIKNTSPWHISIVSAFVADGKKKTSITTTGMITPHSTAQWILPEGAGDKLIINAINDYGGVFSKTYSLVR
ncbi:molecular chaperone [Kosakonia sp. MUSA4]|uniref:fimbrial biogenesis chaperone n=1 Tax=Kosakonia sp. MUSA4 TaxID=2067958 RepID=UPI00159AEF86|nr:molecular chaperone [Kosakonia sp. MUSA4]QJT83399.1 molecular chaperone [Kosakonia sp. MUSA4]